MGVFVGGSNVVQMDEEKAKKDLKKMLINWWSLKNEFKNKILGRFCPKIIFFLDNVQLGKVLLDLNHRKVCF